MGCVGHKAGQTRNGNASERPNPFPKSQKLAKEVITGFDIHLKHVCERASKLKANAASSPNPRGLQDYKFGEYAANPGEHKPNPDFEQAQPIFMPFNRTPSRKASEHVDDHDPELAQTTSKVPDPSPEAGHQQPPELLADAE